MGKKKSGKNLLVAILIVVIAIGSWRLITVNKDFKIVVSRIETIQNQVDTERKEKEEYKLQVANLNSELNGARGRLKKLDTLEADNANLIQTRQQLAKKIADLQEEKRLINEKLHSLKELKKLLREAKIERHNENLKKRIEHEQIRKEIDDQKTSMGNKGFLMKSGKSSYKPSINIEVKPII